MRCTDVEKLISDYSVGNLTRLMSGKVREHLAECVSCSRQLEALGNVMALVEETLQHVEPPVGLWNGVYNRIASRDRETVVDRLRQSISRQRKALSYGVAVSAGIAALLVGATSMHQPPVAERVLEPAAMGYIQSHVVSASYDPLADRVSLGFVGTLSQTEDAQDQ